MHFLNTIFRNQCNDRGALEHRNEIVTLSYADDLAMVTEWSYARINSIRLQLALRQLVKVPDEVQI